MRGALNILCLLVVGVFLTHPQAGYAQNEGAIEIEARILPATSGTVTEGSPSSTGTSTSIQEGDGQQGATEQTGTAQTVGEGGEQAKVPQEPGTTPRQPTNTMTVNSQNSVLVEVEKQNQIFLRRLLNFEGAARQGEIDVGSMEESTTVDIIHVTL